MSGAHDASGSEVGGVAEEALKLVEALSSWAHEHELPPTVAPGGSATGPSPECEWCPLCRALRVVRATSPEVREHLAAAGASLVAAAAAALAPPTDKRGRAPGPTHQQEEQT